jgi:hypothetical protein
MYSVCSVEVLWIAEWSVCKYLSGKSDKSDSTAGLA